MQTQYGAGPTELVWKTGGGLLECVCVCVCMCVCVLVSQKEGKKESTTFCTLALYMLTCAMDVQSEDTATTLTPA